MINNKLAHINEDAFVGERNGDDMLELTNRQENYLMTEISSTRIV